MRTPSRRSNARGALPRWVGTLLLLLSALVLAGLMLYAILWGGAPPEGLSTAEKPGMLAQAGELGRLGSISDVLWYALAALTVGSAAGVAFSRNIIYSAFSLLGAFLGVASMYIYLAAPFVAVTQILIYIGGVLVLILFAVMLTSHIRDVKVSNSSLSPGPGLVGLVALAVLLGYVGGATPWKLLHTTAMIDQSTALGDAFLSTYLLPFEVASVVLLATLIGAIVIARNDKTESGRPS